MIDDTSNYSKPPCTHVSFHDLRQLGFEIYTQSFQKKKPNGEVVEAVKVIKTTKNGKTFPKSHMMELLRVLGLDTSGQVWVEPRKMHRCLSQKEPVYDMRYGAYERLDREYLQSGRASMAAIMYSSNMKDMSEETKKMTKGGDVE